jgi:hypothetical protein
MTKRHKPNKKVKKHLNIPSRTLTVFIVLWVIAAALPAYTAIDSQKSFYGLMCFLWGIVTPLFNPLYFVMWSSNIIALIAISHLFRKKYTTSIKIASIATLCALGALFIRQLPFNESGGEHLVTANIGLYVWIAAIAAPLIGSIVAQKIDKK